MKIFDTLFSKKSKPTYFKFTEKHKVILDNIMFEKFIKNNEITLIIYFYSKNNKNDLSRFIVYYKDKEMFNGVFSNKCDSIILELSNQLINHIFTTEKDLMIYFEKILNNVNEEFILPYFKMKEDKVNEHLNVFDEFTKMLNKN